MLPLASIPTSPKFSVNAPGAAGFSLVTIESGRAGADWADAVAASTTRAAQADIVKHFIPFSLMIMGPCSAYVLWMVSVAVRPPACRARRGHDPNRSAVARIGPNSSLERASGDGTSLRGPRQENRPFGSGRRCRGDCLLERTAP